MARPGSSAVVPSKTRGAHAQLRGLERSDRPFRQLFGRWPGELEEARVFEVVARAVRTLAGVGLGAMGPVLDGPGACGHRHQNFVHHLGKVEVLLRSGAVQLLPVSGTRAPRVCHDLLLGQFVVYPAIERSHLIGCPASAIRYSVVRPAGGVRCFVVRPAGALRCLVVRPAGGVRYFVVRPAGAIRCFVVRPAGGVRCFVVRPASKIESLPLGRPPAAVLTARAVHLSAGATGVQDVLDVVERLRAVVEVPGISAVVPWKPPALTRERAMSTREGERVAGGIASAVAAEDDSAGKVRRVDEVTERCASTAACHVIVRRSGGVDLGAGREIVQYTLIDRQTGRAYGDELVHTMPPRF